MAKGNIHPVAKWESAMNVEIKALGSRGVEISPAGKLNSETVRELRPLLLDSLHPQPQVLLNLSGVESIDAAGMALLMMARVELEASGIRFVVESSNPGLMRTLVAAGMPRFVTIAPRRLDALRALGEVHEPELVKGTSAPERRRQSVTVSRGLKAARARSATASPVSPAS